CISRGTGSEKKQRSSGRSFSPGSLIYTLHELCRALRAREIGRRPRLNVPPVVIISGPPGSGKSSVARRLTEQSLYERAVHLHTDDFYQAIRKGYVAPWLPESQEQNVIVIEAFTASATRYARGGYEVIVDGVVGPWFLDPWSKMAQDGLDVHYVVLRP